jgi:titin
LYFILLKKTIVNYYLRWIKVSSKSLETSCPVKGLENGKRYEFRVMAENIYGVSEPLVCEEAVKAKWPFSIN